MTTPFEERTGSLVAAIDRAFNEFTTTPSVDAMRTLQRISIAIRTFKGDTVFPDVSLLDGNGRETDHLELLKDCADMLEELAGAEILLPATNEEETDPDLRIEGVPFEVSSDRAEQLAAQLRELVASERRGIKADHPLVKCGNCGETATRCDFGNAYCPSCGDPLDGMPEVQREEGESHD